MNGYQKMKRKKSPENIPLNEILKNIPQDRVNYSHQPSKQTNKEITKTKFKQIEKEQHHKIKPQKSLTMTQKTFNKMFQKC